MLQALERQGVSVVLYANGIFGGDTPKGMEWLRAWGEAGHLIGNHTYHHWNLQKTSKEAFLEDVAKLDSHLRPLPGFRPWLRFPYLKEGDTADKRDGVRAGLKRLGYRNTPVTITTFDWLIDERLTKALTRKPNLDPAPYRTFYLQHVVKLANLYQELADHTLGKDIPHVVLLHQNLLNALCLEDLILALRKNGWTLVHPDKAYAHPFYAEQPQTLATGESLLWSLAKERNLGKADLMKLDALYASEKALLEELGL